MNIVERASKDGTKVFYTLEWGRKPGERVSTGIYTYIYPKNKIQRDYNIQSLSNLETLKAQTLLDLQTRGTNFVSPAKLKENFLRFFEKYLEKNRSENNRNLAAFKKFVALEQGKKSLKQIPFLSVLLTLPLPFANGSAMSVLLKNVSPDCAIWLRSSFSIFI